MRGGGGRDGCGDAGGRNAGGRGVWHVPRPDLLGTLVVEVEQGRLRLPGRSALAGGAGWRSEGAWAVVVAPQSAGLSNR